MSKVKMKNGESAVMRRGSVMMEFVIVFPIYLVLIAATFAIGDMLVHSNRLAFGDRVTAFDWETDGVTNVAWENIKTNCFFTVNRQDVHREIDDNGDVQDELRRDGVTNQEDAGVRGGIYADARNNVGPWTVCAFSKVVDRYRPPVGGTLGQLLFCDRTFSETTKTGRDQGMLRTWEDPEGRVSMQSMGKTLLFRDEKDVSDMTCYSYVTLKRRHVGGDRSGPWRNMTSGLLVGERWLTEVAEEKWHEESSIRGRYTAKPTEPNFRDLSDYRRYDRFETWSR